MTKVQAIAEVMKENGGTASLEMIYDRILHIHFYKIYIFIRHEKKEKARISFCQYRKMIFHMHQTREAH